MYIYNVFWFDFHFYIKIEVPSFQIKVIQIQSKFFINTFIYTKFQVNKISDLDEKTFMSLPWYRFNYIPKFILSMNFGGLFTRFSRLLKIKASQEYS